MTVSTKAMLSTAINDFFFAQLSMSQDGGGDNSELRTVLMVRALQREEFPEGAMVMEQGASGDKLYLMESGAADVLMKRGPGGAMGGTPGVVASLKPGSLFGELALICDAPRAASVKCSAPCVLWSLTRHLFHSILGVVQTNTAAKRKKWLSDCPIVSSLGAYQMTELTNSLETLTFRAGEEVQARGVGVTRVLLLERGEVEVKGGEGAEEGGEGGEEAWLQEALGVVRSARDAAEDEIIRRDTNLDANNIHTDTDIIAPPTDSSNKLQEEGQEGGHCPRLREGDIFGVPALPQDSSSSSGGRLWVLQGEGEEAVLPCPVQLVACGSVICTVFSLEVFASLQGPQQEGSPAKRILLGEQNVDTSSQRMVLKSGQFDPAVMRYTSVIDRSPGELLLLGTATAEATKPGGKQQFYAIQAVGKQHLSEQEGAVERAQAQKQLLASLRSQSLMRFHGTYQTPQALFFVEEHFAHGDLWTLLYEDTMEDHYLPPALIQFYTCCILSILTYLHAKHVAYRNLRPENLVFDSKGYLHLKDFRCAKKIPYSDVDEFGDSVLHVKSHTMCESDMQSGN